MKFFSLAMKRVHSAAIIFLCTEFSFANSWHDDSHYIRLGPRTGCYIIRDGSKLSRQLGIDDSPYADTSDPLRHGYGKDVLAFRFDEAGHLSIAPAYIANAQVNDFYLRRIGSLIRGRTTVPEVKLLFGNP